ncbi:MAG: NosD domain-containing protein [Thermoproteota archaeon]
MLLILTDKLGRRQYRFRDSKVDVTCVTIGEVKTASIYLDDSNYNEICHNNILMNWCGILILGKYSIGNKIHRNNMTKNVEWRLLNEASTEVNTC